MSHQEYDHDPDIGTWIEGINSTEHTEFSQVPARGLEGNQNVDSTELQESSQQPATPVHERDLMFRAPLGGVNSTQEQSVWEQAEAPVQQGNSMLPASHEDVNIVNSSDWASFWKEAAAPVQQGNLEFSASQQGVNSTPSFSQQAAAPAHERDLMLRAPLGGVTSTQEQSVWEQAEAPVQQGNSMLPASHEDVNTVNSSDWASFWKEAAAPVQQGNLEFSASHQGVNSPQSFSQQAAAPVHADNSTLPASHQGVNSTNCTPYPQQRVAPEQGGSYGMREIRPLPKFPCTPSPLPAELPLPANRPNPPTKRQKLSTSGHATLPSPRASTGTRETLFPERAQDTLNEFLEQENRIPTSRRHGMPGGVQSQTEAQTQQAPVTQVLSTEN